MKTIIRVFVTLAFFAVVAGCNSIHDRTAKYQALLGKEFVTRSDLQLCKMNYANYDIVPYKLDLLGNAVGGGKVIAVIPKGTVVKFRDAKVSYIGGDWDFLIGELHLPGTNELIVFEDMLGFSSVDPSVVYNRYAPLR